MEFSQLQAFLAVAEQRSFSAAAQALFITQPAVSKRIGALEQQLGSRLFDRLGKHNSLTPAGQALLPAARRTLAEVANCRAAVQALDGRVAGTLALGTSHHIGLRRLPQLLRDYISRYPEVHVDLQLTESEEALSGVLDNRLELAVITLPSEPVPGLISEALWPDPLVFCAAQAHPLASAARVSPADLVRHTAVLPSRSSATRRLLEEQLQAQGQQLGQVLVTNYLETNKGLAAAGLGWALMPRTLLEQGLVELQIPELRLHRVLGMAWREGRTLSAAAIALIGSLRDKSGHS